MADLNSIQAANTTKIVGSDTNGVETNAVSAPTNTPSLSDAGLVTRPINYRGITYSASASNISIVNSATDIWRITGSASKTILIKRIRLSGTTTSGSAIAVSSTLVRRSTANIGGITSTLTNTTYDTTNPPATAVIQTYSTNPITLGISAGIIRAQRIAFERKGIGVEVIWDFADSESQYLTLRGTSESLSINFNATTVTGNNLSISVEWIEV